MLKKSIPQGNRNTIFSVLEMYIPKTHFLHDAAYTIRLQSLPQKNQSLFSTLIDLLKCFSKRETK